MSLLERASRLLEVDAREHAALLPDLGRALRDSGAVDAAEAVLTEAVADARRNGDEHAELKAEIELAKVNFMQELSSPDAAARSCPTCDRVLRAQRATTPTSRTPGS